MIQDFNEFFEIIYFPSGESHVRCKENMWPKDYDKIICRCTNWNDIMHLILADKILTRNQTEVLWVVPFKPFARQDRVTGSGHSNETLVLEQMLQGMLNRIIFLDVHSQPGKDFVPYTEITQLSIVRTIFRNIVDMKRSSPNEAQGYTGHELDRIIWLCPDKGAKNKITNQADGRHVGDLHFCTKNRDTKTGKLFGFTVPELHSKGKVPKQIYLIDDICDGGGTFIGIAEKIQHLRKDGIELNLLVTHGIFSKGLEVLFQNFDNIYTTDSYKQNIEFIEKYPERFHVYCIENFI